MVRLRVELNEANGYSARGSSFGVEWLGVGRLFYFVYEVELGHVKW